MAETYCPYCYGKNVSKVAYCFRGVNKSKNKNINYKDYLKKNTVLGKRKIQEKYDFDGEKIKTCKSYNRFCNDCNRMFSSMRNMTYSDIRKVNIIFGTSNYRKKIVFDFNNNKKIINYIKDYVTKKIENINEDDVYNILYSLKSNKTYRWKGMYGNNYSYNNFYWLLKIEYYNGISDIKSGNDEYPPNWNNFIKIINITLNRYGINI